MKWIPNYIYKFISIGKLFIDFRLFGTTGYCAACNKVIPAFEMVMRARTNVYHLECFACQQCNHRWVFIELSGNSRFTIYQQSQLPHIKHKGYSIIFQVLCWWPILSVWQQNSMWIWLWRTDGICKPCIQPIKFGTY